MEKWEKVRGLCSSFSLNLVPNPEKISLRLICEVSELKSLNLTCRGRKTAYNLSPSYVGRLP